MNEKILESFRNFRLKVDRDKANKADPSINNYTNSNAPNGQGQM